MLIMSEPTVERFRAIAYNFLRRKGWKHQEICDALSHASVQTLIELNNGEPLCSLSLFLSRCQDYMRTVKRDRANESFYDFDKTEHVYLGDVENPQILQDISNEEYAFILTLMRSSCVHKALKQYPAVDIIKLEEILNRRNASLVELEEFRLLNTYQRIMLFNKYGL